MAKILHTEEKQANGDQQAHKKTWDQSIFWSSETMFFDLRLYPIVVVKTVTGHANHQGDDNREKCQIGLAKVEIINDGIHQRE